MPGGSFSLMPLSVHLVALGTFLAGLLMVWWGLYLKSKSLWLFFAALLGGCILALLGALTLTSVGLDDGVREMAWLVAPLLGAFLFKYGPAQSGRVSKRIALAAIPATIAASMVSGANYPKDGILAILFVLLFWFSLARVHPSRPLAIVQRKAAYAALILFAGSIYVSLRETHFFGKDEFEAVIFPFDLVLRLPHPYDYYITYQLTKYMVFSSFFLSFLCSLACLIVWALEAQAPPSPAR